MNYLKISKEYEIKYPGISNIYFVIFYCELTNQPIILSKLSEYVVIDTNKLLEYINILVQNKYVYKFEFLDYTLLTTGLKRIKKVEDVAKFLGLNDMNRIKLEAVVRFYKNGVEVDAEYIYLLEFLQKFATYFEIDKNHDNLFNILGKMLSIKNNSIKTINILQLKRALKVELKTVQDSATNVTSSFIAMIHRNIKNDKLCLLTDGKYDFEYVMSKILKLMIDHSITCPVEQIMRELIEKYNLNFRKVA